MDQILGLLTGLLGGFGSYEPMPIETPAQTTE